MATLHIEHRITDFATWKAAFDRFARARTEAGVRRERLWTQADDPQQIVVQLDFDDAEAARAFLGFLQAKVWSTPENSPALDGAPAGRILESRS